MEKLVPKRLHIEFDHVMGVGDKSQLWRNWRGCGHRWSYLYGFGEATKSRRKWGNNQKETKVSIVVTQSKIGDIDDDEDDGG